MAENNREYKETNRKRDTGKRTWEELGEKKEKKHVREQSIARRSQTKIRVRGMMAQGRNSTNCQERRSRNRKRNEGTNERY